MQPEDGIRPSFYSKTITIAQCDGRHNKSKKHSKLEGIEYRTDNYLPYTYTIQYIPLNEYNLWASHILYVFFHSE